MQNLYKFPIPKSKEFTEYKRLWAEINTHIQEMNLVDQKKVFDAYNQIANILNESEPYSLLAFALLGAFMQANEEE